MKMDTQLNFIKEPEFWIVFLIGAVVYYFSNN